MKSPFDLNPVSTVRDRLTIYSKVVRHIKIATVMEQATSVEKLDEPELAARFWHETIELSPWFDTMKEHMAVILLNTRYHIVGYTVVSIGSLNESIAHPRDIFRPAVIAGAYAIIIMHNHPSGDPSPSQTDHSLTRRLMEGAELLQIKLLDHVVVGRQQGTTPGYFSFKEAGVL